MELEAKTSPELLEKLRHAAGRHMSEDEQREQRISYVYGSIDHDGNDTRSEVKQFFEKLNCI